MNANSTKTLRTNTLEDTIREAVSTLLSNLVADEASLLGGLDGWTQRRVVTEISAKVNAVLESSDPARHCYQDLIRDIDSEAQMGVLLANSLIGPDDLRHLCIEPGVSGELYSEMERIAPVIFAAELEQADGDLDLVWESVQAQYDRSRLEADVSELIMRFFLDSADSAHDMTNALRSMFYEFHEAGIRRQLDMASLLDEREMHDLVIMVSELIYGAGLERSSRVAQH